MGNFSCENKAGWRWQNSFCVYRIHRLWLCYDGDTENEFNIINFFDMFKENSSNKFKVKANMFLGSRRKMRLSNSINSSTVFVYWCADYNHSWCHHVITEERFSHLYNFERFGAQLEQQCFFPQITNSKDKRAARCWQNVCNKKVINSSFSDPGLQQCLKLISVSKSDWIHQAKKYCR